MESRSNHRSGSRAADVSLATNGKKEQRCFYQPREQQPRCCMKGPLALTFLAALNWPVSAMSLLSLSEAAFFESFGGSVIHSFNVLKI